MKGIETGRDKVKKICDVLRNETLVPAMEEAEKIIALAKIQAEELLAATYVQVEKIKVEARKEIEKEKNIFQSSLNQSCKLALESLKQNIESKLFDQELAQLITKQTQDPHVLAELITALVKGIEKEGLDVSLSAYIPASVSPRSVNHLLAQTIIEKLREKSVLISNATGGVTLSLHQDRVTIDLSDKALKDLVAQYIRKDFRAMIFG